MTTEELARSRAAPLRRMAADVVPTRSVLEDLVLDLILEAGFERPDVNLALVRDRQRFAPDFRWPARGSIIEADGAATHDHDLARLDDARREHRLRADRIVRVSWRRAVLQPQRTVRVLRELEEDTRPGRSEESSSYAS